MNTPVISIDVEDWLQSTWDRSLPIAKRSEANTYHLIELLDRIGAKTTMFVLGKFAKTYPKVVKELAKAGHEIGSHGYGHVESFTQTKEEFKEDITKAKSLLEDITGEEVIGHRAPDFSIVRKNLWAIEILAEAGFKYDSSINPIQHNRYGIAEFPTTPVVLNLAKGNTITEFPIASFPIGKKNYPIGGGGYHRLFPGFVTRYCAKKILKKNEFIFYCHPYEFNGHEFQEIEIPIPWKTKLHQGLGRGKLFENRFINFIKAFGSQRFIDLYTSDKKWNQLALSSV